MLVDADDTETEELPSGLLIFRSMFKSLEPVHFGDIVEILKILNIINSVITIIKIVLTTGPTSDTPKRSFSCEIRIKTWFRSSTSQKHLLIHVRT